MRHINVVTLCEQVLIHICKMDFEQRKGYSSGQLIFPMKIQAQGTKFKDRISEQELRLLFIEEFKNNYPHLFFSIETPTIFKHAFGKLYEDIKSDGNGQSASIDMCIFERVSDEYKRILNVEFKSKNPQIKHIAKDILKLMSEEHNGAFIHLLENTNDRTFCNSNETGIFNKYYKSFADFHLNWAKDKVIHLVIISLKQKKFIHREIRKEDLINLKSIFFIGSTCGNIDKIISKGWKVNQL